MAELIITIQGDKALLDRLKKIDLGLENMSQPFKTAGTMLTKFFSSVPFASQGSVYGTRWPALSSQYARRKTEMWGGGRPILVASGKLMKSFKFTSSKDLLRIYNETGDLFAWHQLGMGNNPQRIMMLLDDQRKKVVTDPVEEHIRKLVENG